MKLIDEKIVDNAYKCLGKEKQNPQLIKEENTIIEEGIKYFKASPRLYKLALKIERKAQKHGENKELDTLVRKINALANTMENLEDQYYLSRNKKDKAIASVKYKMLEKQYADIIKMMRKSDVIDALKKIGAVGFTVASMALPYIMMSKFFPGLVSVNSVDATGWDKTGLYLKRAGAFTLCGLPLRITRSGISALTSDAEMKILARTDKLLKDSEIDTKDYTDDELHQLS
jgi:hypothetical protein